MAPRVSTGKRLRFDVFERDHFTCQYCGAQPPDVLLVCDHVLPVVAGGETAFDNLTTACEACNQGKAGRVLGALPSRPDADLQYLAAQQEIAEALRYERAAAELRAVQTRIVNTMQAEWQEASGLDWSPTDSFLLKTITSHGYDATAFAVRDVATKIASGYITDRGNRWISYLVAVARNTAQEMLTAGGSASEDAS